MQLFLKLLSGRTLTVEFESSDLVEDVKKQIANLLNDDKITSEKLSLRVISDYNIQKELNSFVVKLKTNSGFKRL